MAEFDPKQMAAYADEASNAKAHTDKIKADLADASKSLKGMGSMYGGEFADAMMKASEGVKDIVTGILSFNPLSMAASIKGIADGVFKLAQAADKVDEYMANVNRSMYDISAHMGDLGVNSAQVRDIASDLAPKYGKFAGEIDQIVKGVADIGVSSEHIRDVTDDILNLSTIWADMTPEKQLQMMSGYMKEFGLNSKEAHNVVKNLVLDANLLKESITELDVDEFINQINTVAINTRSWNVDLYEAQAFVEGLAMSFGDTAESMQRAGDIAPKLMGYGMGDLGMQAFMMGEAGVSGDVFKQIGEFTLNSEKRAEAQLNTFESMVSRISGGEELVDIADEERLAGMLQVGAQGGVLPGFTPVEIAKLVEGGGAGTAEILTKIRMKLEETAEKEAEAANAQKALPQNVDQIMKDVTKLTDRVMISIEASVRDSAFYLKEMVQGPGELREKKEMAGDLISGYLQDMSDVEKKEILSGGRGTDMLKVTLGSQLGLPQEEVEKSIEAFKGRAQQQFTKESRLLEEEFTRGGTGAGLVQPVGFTAEQLRGAKVITDVHGKEAKLKITVESIESGESSTINGVGG